MTLEQFRTNDTAVEIIESDFRNVDYSGLGKFNVYFFDGAHDRQDQFEGLRLPLHAMDDEFVFIVDDWNWPQVRSGTLEAVAALELTEELSIAVRTTLDDSHPNHHWRAGGLTDWHNGYLISVLRKPSSQ